MATAVGEVNADSLHLARNKVILLLLTGIVTFTTTHAFFCYTVLCVNFKNLSFVPSSGNIHGIHALAQHGRLAGEKIPIGAKISEFQSKCSLFISKLADTTCFCRCLSWPGELAVLGHEGIFEHNSGTVGQTCALNGAIISVVKPIHSHELD